MADNFFHTNTITKPLSMEIINSEQYKRANIKFSGIPSKEVRTELKNEGWLFSHNHNVWYPRNFAAENSYAFANHIKMTYFPEPQIEVNIVTEASEKSELAEMVQNGSTLKEILAKLSDMYGENAVSEAFSSSKEQLENQIDFESEPLEKPKDPRTELALQKNQTSEIFVIHKSESEEWDFTTYDKDLNEIDSGTMPCDGMDILEASKKVLDEYFPENDFANWEETDYNELEEAVEYKEASDLAAQIRKEDAELSEEEEESESDDDAPTETENFGKETDPLELPYSEQPHFDTFATPIPENVQESMNEVRKETLENEPSFNINGETYTQKEIEGILEEDLQMIFRELVPEPYIEEVRLYKNPEKDGKISLLAQYGTNETEGF